MTEPFITSVDVRCSRGGHEYVSVWIRGQNVGTLCVGKGDGQALREVLLPGATGFEEEPTVAERPCARELRDTVLVFDPSANHGLGEVHAELLDRALGMGSPKRFRTWDERPEVIAEQRIVEPPPALDDSGGFLTVTPQQRAAMERIRDASFRQSPIGQRMHPGTICPADLEADAVTLGMARALGMSPEQVIRATESFRSYWAAHETHRLARSNDWQGKLRHWLRQVATSPAVQR